MANRIYKNVSEKWRAQNIKIGANVGTLRSLIVNISRKKQDIVERKAALQTAVSPVHTLHLIRRTLVHKW